MSDLFTFRLKALYFAVWAGNGVLYPFEPVFFGALGIPKSQVGILTMMPSFFRFVFAPAFGLLGDTYKIHAEILICSLVLTAAAKLCELYMKTFTTVLIVMMISSFLLSPTNSQIDSITLSLISDKSIYGSMRLWGAISYGLFTLLGGIFLSFNDSSSQLEAVGIFWKIFFCFAVCLISGSFIIYSILQDRKKVMEDLDNEEAENLRFQELESSKKQQENGNDTNNSVLTDVVKLFVHNKILFSFYIIMLLSGIAAGVIESFLFLRLKELGGTGLVMGLSKAIMCIAEVPIFSYTGVLQEKYGTWSLLSLTQTAFVIRFIYYTFATNPWLILPCELLHGVTYAMTWNVSCTYVNAISPSNCASTMQALNDGLHRGIGYGLGTVLGGFVYQYYGAVRLFEYSGILSAISLSLAVSSWWVQARKGSLNRDQYVNVSI